MPFSDWTFTLVIVLTSYLIMGITGFGSALVMVPLLARQWPLSEVVVMTILLDIPASILHGGLNLRNVRWRELLRLLPGLAVGTTLGFWLLGQLDQRWLLLILGSYVVFVGLKALVQEAPSRRPISERWVHVAGTLVGLVEVMFATAGPLVVAWLQRNRNDVAGLRATVPVVMVLAGSIALAIMIGTTQINAKIIFPKWLVTLPAAGAGVMLGNRLTAHISPFLMKRIMSVLLAISGLMLMRHFWV